jgi:hypothetical protein
MELKKSITRSFTRKVNTGNFQSFDVFSSRTQEVPFETTDEELQVLSTLLFSQCMDDVRNDIDEAKKMITMFDKIDK